MSFQESQPNLLSDVPSRSLPQRLRFYALGFAVQRPQLILVRLGFGLECTDLVPLQQLFRF